MYVDTYTRMVLQILGFGSAEGQVIETTIHKVCIEYLQYHKMGYFH